MTTTNYEICEVPNYNITYPKSNKLLRSIDEISFRLENNDKSYHERLHKTDLLKLCVDVDKLQKHNPTTTLGIILNDICEYVGVNLEDISYTTNSKASALGSHHIVIPSLYMVSSQQKKYWDIFRQKYKYGKEIDVGIMDKDGWFRLPNQTKGLLFNKKNNCFEDISTVEGSQHIITQGNIEDFVLKYIEKSTLFLPKEEPKEEEVIEEKTDDESILSDITHITVSNEMDDIDEETYNLIAENDLDKMDEIEKKLFILQKWFGEGQHHNWMKIAVCIKNIFSKNLKIGKTYFGNATMKYGTEKKKREWEDFYDNKINIQKYNTSSERTLNFYCFNENKKLYEEICVDYFIGINDADDAYKTATIIQKSLKEKLVYCNKNWWCLNDKNMWIKDEPALTITKEYRKYMDYSVGVINAKIRNESEEPKKEEMRKMIELYLCFIKKSSKTNWKNDIKQFLVSLLADVEFENKLDRNIHKLVFKNGMYDLDTSIFQIGFKSYDYITKFIPYDYTPNYDKTKMKFLKNVLLKIMNNNVEHLEYFLSIIGFCFLGTPHLEKSLYFGIDKTEVSSGDNGKTFFFDILTHLMPNYVYKTKKSFLEADNKKSHKQLALMKGIYLSWMDEYDKTKQNYELMKIIGDGNSIENEVMYGTSENIEIFFKMFILTNHIPNIPNNETAVYNRFKQISFNSHFDRSGEREEEDIDNLLFIADITLGDKIKTEYFNEVFHLVIEYAKKYIENKGLPSIPLQFQNDTNATKTTNDKFKLWFIDNCVVDSDSKVALKKIITESECKEDVIKQSMIKMGYKYNKDLSGLGKDNKGKPYKGGYVGIKILDEDNQLDC
jgi:phage/plasmid-associated DNA primase